MPIGPAALGHDPVVLKEQREKVLDKIEESGAISFRDNPMFPYFPDK